MAPTIEFLIWDPCLAGLSAILTVAQMKGQLRTAARRCEVQENRTGEQRALPADVHHMIVEANRGIVDVMAEGSTGRSKRILRGGLNSYQYHFVHIARVLILVSAT